VEVDVARKRIGLTMKRDSGEARAKVQERTAPPPKPARGPMETGSSSGGNAFADALKGKFGR
jgi:protein Tex